MTQLISPLAGKPLPAEKLVDIQSLLAAYADLQPDPTAPSQRVAFGTSGHRGTSFDGIVITPSHNPPDSGGFKYNPPHGGPADANITGWVQQRANALLEGGLEGVKRMALAEARTAATTHEHDYLGAYVADLGSVIDKAPANGAPIGGIKVSAKSGWFAARPSGTEDIYKIYAESFRDDAHLRRLLAEAQRIVDTELDFKEST